MKTAPARLPIFMSEAHPCEYLPDQRAEIAYRLLPDVAPDELDGLLARGWRRFGPIGFRPACGGCTECVSLRIRVDDFRPSRGQGRARNRCAHLVAELTPPRVDDERLALYARWHAGREATRGWEPSPLSAADYRRSFLANDACARELTYRADGRLVGVGICDETADAFSAAYFFHDPECARLSPGTNHVLELVERARRAGKTYVYLGFRVLGCASMRYKAGFQPHQLLQGRPGDDEAPAWADHLPSAAQRSSASR